MKLLYILITIILSSGIEQEEEAILGHWKLTAIEIDQILFHPEKKDYFLTITKEKLTYNLEVNNCLVTDFTLSDNQIKYPAGPICTLIGGDGMYDPISNYISYNGDYEIKENALIVTTEEATLFLERQDE